MNNNIDTEQELIDRLAEEFSERYRRGQQPSIHEYVERYPSVAEKLKELLPSVALMEQLKRNRRPIGAADEGKRLERLGDYRILREVGRGGMGIVYEARQESLDRRVALKVLPRHSLLDPKRLARFRIEAQAAARMHHTNIVPVFGLFESDGMFYYAMQFIEGQGLDQVLTSLKQGQWARETRRTKGNKKPTRKFSTQTQEFTGAKPGLQAEFPAVAARTSAAQPIETGPPVTPARLPIAVGQRPVRNYWDQVAAIGMQVAEALQYAHEQGALHRDIKPANLLLDGRGTVWVTDFGLAKLLEHDNLTSTGDVVGTLQYMAPESIHGQFDARSDVYSLGLTLYELLTLETPFEETNPAKLLKLVSDREPAAPRRRNPAIPRDLETIVLKAISRDPNHRYPVARQLAADLRRFLEDKPIKARRVAAIERGWRWCRRNRTLAVLSAVALNSLLLAAIFGCWGYASTVRALKLESQRLSEAKVATVKAEANMQMSLDALQSIFAALAERKKPPAPPGRAGGPHKPGGPPQGPQHAAHGPNGQPPDKEREPGGERHEPGGERHEPGGEQHGPGPDRGQAEFDATLLQTVLKFYDRFAQENATDPKLKIDAADAYCRVADAQNRLGRPDQAAIAYARAAELCEQLRKELPDDPRAAATLVEINLGWAGLQTSAIAAQDSAELKKRQARAQQADKLAAALVKRYPQQPNYVVLQADVEQMLGTLGQQEGNFTSAEGHYRRAIDLKRGLILSDAMPRNKLDHMIDGLAEMQQEFAKFFMAVDRPNDAKTFFDTSLAELEPAKPNRRVREMRIDLFEAYADLLTELGEKEKAGQMQDKADAIESLGRPDPPPRPPGGHGPPGDHGPPGGHGPPPGPHRGPHPPEHPHGPAGKPPGAR
jgi:serine/threonine protein kinase